MAILLREGLWHADDHTFLSMQIWCQGELLRTNDDWVGLGKVAFKAFGPGALEIPWMGLGKTRGSKP